MIDDELTDPIARAIVAQVRSLGWRVSVFHDSGAYIRGTEPRRRDPSTELHAKHRDGNQQPQVARATGPDPLQNEATAAAMLAEAIGLELEDG